VIFASWCKYNNVPSYHLPQETYTKSWNQKRKNKIEGVVKGVSDYLVILPEKKCRLGRAIILFIELKRKKPTLKNGKLGAPLNKATQEQLDFIALVTEVQNVEGYVAYGSEEAIALVEKYMVK
jgi:hypothetical protein